MLIYCSKTGHQIRNDLASPNVQIQPQRRRSRYTSRENTQNLRLMCDEPARERRHSQDRRQLYEAHQRRQPNDINQEWHPHQRRQSRDNKW